MAKFSKKIGIVGGAGPMASAFLYASILKICQEKYNSSDYSDFPEILLYSYPFSREKIQPQIAKCFAALKKAGASLFCIVSHSFHGFLPKIPRSQFVHLVEESLKEARKQKISKALILASQKTVELNLYQEIGVYPPLKDQVQIQKLIHEVAGGTIHEKQTLFLKKMISRLHRHLFFDGVILACTELPLIHAKFPIQLPIPVLDTMQLLAQILIRKAKRSF